MTDTAIRLIGCGAFAAACGVLYRLADKPLVVTRWVRDHIKQSEKL